MVDQNKNTLYYYPFFFFLSYYTFTQYIYYHFLFFYILLLFHVNAGRLGGPIEGLGFLYIYRGKGLAKADAVRVAGVGCVMPSSQFPASSLTRPGVHSLPCTTWPVCQFLILPSLCFQIHIYTPPSLSLSLYIPLRNTDALILARTCIRSNTKQPPPPSSPFEIRPVSTVNSLLL